MFIKVGLAFLSLCLLSVSKIWADDQRISSQDRQAFHAIQVMRGLSITNVNAVKIDDPAVELYQYTSQVRVCGKAVGVAHSYADLASWLGNYEMAMHQCSASVVRIEMPDAQFDVSSAPLGSGTRGIVFSLSDADLVLKLPTSELKSVQRMLEEANCVRQVESSVRKLGLSIADNIYFQPMGLYAVKQKIHGITLTEWLLNESILVPDATAPSHFKLNPMWPKMKHQDRNVVVIEQVQRLIDDGLKTRVYAVDMGSNNFLIDSNNRLWVVDPGLSKTSNPESVFYQVINFETYIHALLAHHLPLYQKQKNFSFLGLNIMCQNLLRGKLPAWNRYYKATH